jgi:hypothetical protein
VSRTAGIGITPRSRERRDESEGRGFAGGVVTKGLRGKVVEATRLGIAFEPAVPSRPIVFQKPGAKLRKLVRGERLDLLLDLFDLAHKPSVAGFQFSIRLAAHRTRCLLANAQGVERPAEPIRSNGLLDRFFALLGGIHGTQAFNRSAWASFPLWPQTHLRSPTGEQGNVDARVLQQSVIQEISVSLEHHVPRGVCLLAARVTTSSGSPKRARTAVSSSPSMSESGRDAVSRCTVSQSHNSQLESIRGRSNARYQPRPPKAVGCMPKLDSSRDSCG